MTDKLPEKGDIVINPGTQRPVKVGSRTWLNLVKKGVFPGKYKPKAKVKFKEPQPEPEEPAPAARDVPPEPVKPVRKRRTNKKSAKIAKVATKVFSENIDALVSAGYDFDAELERLILEELDSELPLEKPKLVRQEGIHKRGAPRGRGRPIGRKNKPKPEPVEDEIWDVLEPDEYPKGSLPP